MSTGLKIIVSWHLADFNCVNHVGVKKDNLSGGYKPEKNTNYL